MKYKQQTVQMTGNISFNLPGSTDVDNMAGRQCL